ncbi:hypothetical protein EOL96_00560 [Candidatus Saccharibacteria bacterium]|nr:hypothetical protein [Candidatus Saccharibacteria bacterium]
MSEKYIFEEYRNIGGPDELPDTEVTGIQRCIRTGFSGGIRDDDAREHMLGDQIIVVRDPSFVSPEDGTSVVGFTSTLIASPYDLFKYEDTSRQPAGYFAGAALDARYQGKGLYGELFSRRFNFVAEHDVDSIFTRTQNPAVFKGMSRALENLIIAGDIRSYNFGQRICERAYYGRLKTDMRTEFPYVDSDAGDALLLMWQLQRW